MLLKQCACVLVVDSSSDDDSSILEDESSRLSNATPRPQVPGAGSHRSRGSVESHGSSAATQSAQPGASGGSDGKGAQRSVAARGTPPHGAPRDVETTPPTSQPSGMCTAVLL